MEWKDMIGSFKKIDVRGIQGNFSTTAIHPPWPAGRSGWNAGPGEIGSCCPFCGIGI